MPKKKEKITAIILNWNQIELTKECLRSVLKSKTEDKIEIEPVVVDNGSTDNSKEDLRKLKSQTSPLKIIFNKENLGFAGGNNVGIRDALKNGADFIFILNNDTEVKDDCILNLWQTFGKDEKIGASS